jgi:integrase/recombinase XerD
MNTLREAVTDYLAMRRNLGYKLKLAGTDLLSFVEFMEKQNASWITIPLALEWAQQPTLMEPSGWAKRLGYVRGFARHRSATDPRTEIPSSQLLPYRANRANPYLYSPTEIQALLTAALNIPPASALARHTYYCLFGLLAVSGMRISEILNLKLDEVDLENGILTINGTKFGKSRLVPLHETTREVLRSYKVRRQQFFQGFSSEFFFVSRTGTRLRDQHVERTFLRLSRRIGLRAPEAKSGPRLQDFRHRFAIETLLRWYRGGEDSERLLPLLSTYLGHVDVKSTYWYLTACPELMGEAVKRLERRWEPKQ